MRDSVHQDGERNLIWDWNTFLFHRGMHCELFITARKRIQHISGEGFTFFIAFLMLAPWTVINITIDTAHIAMREAHLPYVYASSYSSVTTSATANGTTVVMSSSDNDPTSSSVSVSHVQNGVDGADGVRGTDGADGAHGSDGRDGVMVSTSAPGIKENDETRIQILRILIEKLEQLLILLRGNN